MNYRLMKHSPEGPTFIKSFDDKREAYSNLRVWNDITCMMCFVEEVPDGADALLAEIKANGEWEAEGKTTEEQR